MRMIFMNKLEELQTEVLKNWKQVDSSIQHDGNVEYHIVNFRQDYLSFVLDYMKETQTQESFYKIETKMYMDDYTSYYIKTTWNNSFPKSEDVAYLQALYKVIVHLPDHSFSPIDINDLENENAGVVNNLFMDTKALQKFDYDIIQFLHKTSKNIMYGTLYCFGVPILHRIYTYNEKERENIQETIPKYLKKIVNITFGITNEKIPSKLELFLNETKFRIGEWLENKS